MIVGNPSDVYVFAIYYFFIPSLIIFTMGAIYRLTRYWVLWKRGAPAQPKEELRSGHAVRDLVETFIEPVLFTARHNFLAFLAGLIALHIVGVIPVLFLLAEHIVWWRYYLPFYSILWPLSVPLSMTSASLVVTSPVMPATDMMFRFINSLWGPLAFILNGDLAAILILIGIGYKVGEKIMKKLKSRAPVPRLSDFVDLGLLFAIILTGYAAARHWPSPDVVTYRTMLGLHVLFAELLLMWLPFSKYWHFVFGYWYGKFHEWYDLSIKRGEENV